MELIKSFFRTTIDSVIYDINKKVQKLRYLAEQHHKQHLLHNETAISAQNAAVAEAENRDRANRIADKFNELLN